MGLRAITGVAAVCAALLLAGCQTAPRNVQLAFVNDSGRPLTIQMAGHDSAVPAGSSPAFAFRVLTEACAYLYSLPTADIPRTRQTLQIEADFSIYATDSSKAVPLAQIARSQPRGFPLKPVSVDCGAPANGPGLG